MVGLTFEENKYENTWVSVAVILWNNQAEKGWGNQKLKPCNWNYLVKAGITQKELETSTSSALIFFKVRARRF